MYFVINKNTTLFAKLTAIKTEMNRVQKEAFILGVKFKGCAGIVHGFHVLAGGLSGIKFKQGPPNKNWKCVDESLSVYFPKAIAVNAHLLDEIKMLPVVKYDVLNKLIKFKEQTIEHSRGLTFYRAPGVWFGKKFIVVKVDERCKYKPVVGMKEVVVSHGLNLIKQIDNEPHALIKISDKKKKVKK